MRSSLDLAATMVLAFLGLALALLPVEPWMRASVLLPMVLVLPGYALAAALFPRGTLPAAERAVYVVALSFAGTVLSGVVVQLFLELHRQSWAVLLFLVTLTASAAAHLRRERFSEQGAPSWPPPTVQPLSALGAVAAVAIAAWAISIASVGARNEQADSHFAGLWALPRGATTQPGGRIVAVGVENHQIRPSSYRVRVTQGGVALASWRIRLDPKGSWRTSLSAREPSASKPLVVTLLRSGSVYRRVVLKGSLDS